MRVPGELASTWMPLRKLPKATSPTWRLPLELSWSKPWSPLFHDTFSSEMLLLEPPFICSPESWLLCQRFRRSTLRDAENMNTPLAVRATGSTFPNPSLSSSVVSTVKLISEKPWPW